MLPELLCRSARLDKTDSSSQAQIKGKKKKKRKIDGWRMKKKINYVYP